MSAVFTPKFQLFNGFKFSPLTYPEDCLSYEAREDDVFITTYPKNGTTWVQMIVAMILNEGKLPDLYYEKGLYAIIPHLEFEKGADMKTKRPLAIKTHLPYDLHPKHPSAKYLVVIRNPKDVCVSFYHHHKNFVKYYGTNDMDFHAFFRFWISGEVDCGDYFDFVLSWWNRRHEPNVLILFYEKMKMDPKSHVLKIAEFMGEDYSRKLRENDDKILNEIVDGTKFENTKEHLEKYTFNHYGGMPGTNPLARKGIIGDWKNHFTDEENRELEEVFHKRLDGTGLEKMWDEFDIFS